MGKSRPRFLEAQTRSRHAYEAPRKARGEALGTLFDVMKKRLAHPSRFSCERVGIFNFWILAVTNDDRTEVSSSHPSQKRRRIGHPAVSLGHPPKNSSEKGY